MIASRQTLLVAATLLLSGCVMADYQDVGAKPEYRGLLGQQLETVSPAILHAVTLDRNYAKRVDLCVIDAPPGFGGPEVVFHRQVPAHTSFKVQSVRQCTNCLLDQQVEIVLSTKEAGLSCGAAPITIDLGLLRSEAPLFRQISQEHT